MHTMNLFQSIVDLLKNQENFALATILARSGSAPRAVGTRMVVRSDRSILGTVGGGILEAQVQKLAAQVLLDRNTLLREFDLTAEDASNMGMICGGDLQVMIQFVDADDPSNLQLYESVVNALKTRRRSWLITGIPTNGSEASPRQSLATKDGFVVGWTGAPDIASLTPAPLQPQRIRHNGSEYLLEPLCGGGTVYIFGAGHISQKLAPLAQLVGFHTVVLDDRPEFANRRHFEATDEIIVIHSFENALEGLDLDDASYLVLVTRGHAHDKTVLRQALGSKAGYIGMIGSRRKRDGIYRDLASEGFDASHFSRVHSPIGLDIGGETPEEIAVSIVAELIQVRAGTGR